jgi:hypothetical protein
MNRTSQLRSAQRVRSSEEIPDCFADELRRYDDPIWRHARYRRI